MAKNRKNDSERADTFGERLYRLRVNRGLTQNQLGQMVGLRGGAIGDYENGHAYPKHKTLLKIGKIFKVDFHRLLTGETHRSVPLELIGGEETFRQFLALRAAILKEEKAL